MSESKVWIECDGLLKMLYRCLDVFGGNGVVDIPSYSVTAAEILFVRGSVGSSMSRQVNLLMGAKLQVQTVNYALGDYVLHSNDIARVGVDPVSPNHIAALYIEQLGCNADPRSHLQETRGKDRLNFQFAAGLAWISCLS